MFHFPDYIATGLEKTKEPTLPLDGGPIEKKEVLRVTPAQDVLRSYHWFGSFTYLMAVIFFLLALRLRDIAKEEQRLMLERMAEEEAEESKMEM